MRNVQRRQTKAYAAAAAGLLVCWSAGIYKNPPKFRPPRACQVSRPKLFRSESVPGLQRFAYSPRPIALAQLRK